MQNNQDEQDILGLFENPKDDSEMGRRDTSFKDVVIRHVERCIVEGSKEMSSSGTTKRILDNGRVLEIPVPNQIEVYCNCVKTLMESVGFILKDDKRKEQLKQLIKRSNDLYDHFFDSFTQFQTEWNKKNHKYRVMNHRIYLQKIKEHNIIKNHKTLKLHRNIYQFLIECLNQENFLGKKGVSFD